MKEKLDKFLIFTRELAFFSFFMSNFFYHYFADKCDVVPKALANKQWQCYIGNVFLCIGIVAIFEHHFVMTIGF